MKTIFLFTLFFTSSFFTIKAQYSSLENFGDISNKNNAINTFDNFTFNTKSNLNKTLFASNNHSNEPSNLSQQCSYNNLKFELDKKLIFKKENGYQTENSSNYYLKLGSRKKKSHGRAIAGAIVGGLGVVQMVVGIALIASSPVETTATGPGQVTVSPTTKDGVIGTFILVNGGFMTAIGVKLLIPKKSKNRFGGGGRRRR